MRLLLLRPELDARRTAAALRALGHDVVTAPLMRIEAVSDLRIGARPWAAILVTSANAARAIAAHARTMQLRALPVFAVGQQSARTMNAAGFANVSSVDGDVRAMATFVARNSPGSPLLYLAGEDRSGDLAGALRDRGFEVETVIVYRAIAETNFPFMAADALVAGLDGVLHFSRRSAETYIALSRKSRLEGALKPIQFCLSEQVAEPLRRAGAASIRIAPRPTEAALLELIGTS
jgi:uroporphyrinogen-III synthase